MSTEIAPLPPQEPREMTSLERAACDFVYHLAKEMDAKKGKSPTREADLKRWAT